MEVIGTITSKGQITIPRDVRQAMGLQPGDSVTFQIQQQQLLLRKNAEHPSCAGLLRNYGKNVSLSDENIQQAIQHAIAETSS